MKRISKILIMTVLTISLMTMTACGKNGNTKPNEGSQVNNQGGITPGVEENSTKEDPKLTKTPEKEIEDDSLTEKEYIPNFIHEGKAYGYTDHVFFNSNLEILVPDYHEVSHGLQNFHVGDILTIGYYAGSKNHTGFKENMLNTEIMEIFGNVFYRGTARYIDGEFDQYEFDSEEEVTINGIDMIRYEGNLIVTGYDEYDKRYVVAYVFTYNGFPNAIFGCVGDYKQPQEYIDELIHNVDESAKTIKPLIR